MQQKVAWQDLSLMFCGLGLKSVYITEINSN